ncbi:hypothetical protein [Dipodfec virus UOA04_Rod_720]|nr:hypothetical protein [Dipodfec virus UOA04_Rod_720]
MVVSILFRYAYKMECDGKGLTFYYRPPMDILRFVDEFRMYNADTPLDYCIKPSVLTGEYEIYLPLSSLFLALFGQVKCSIRCTNRKIYSQVYEIAQIPPQRSEKLEAKPSAHADI